MDESASNSTDLDTWSRDLRDDLRDEVHERWAFIDRLVEGKAKFEAATFWAVIREIGLSKGTVNNRLSIGAKFPVSRRRETLLPAIHNEFCKLDDGLTAHALKNADEGHWTREECRMRMKAFRAGDVRSLEPEWRPAPVRSKATPAETPAEGEKDSGSVFDATGAGQAMAAEDRCEKRDAYAEQKFSSGNDFFERIAATIERKGDPHRFIRECDVKRLNPVRARALAAFFLGVAEEIERSNGGALAGRFNSALPPAPAEEVAADDAEASVAASASDLTTASPTYRPGDRERLGRAQTSEDEISVGDAGPSGAVCVADKSSHLADEFETGPVHPPQGDGEHPTERERSVVQAGPEAVGLVLHGIQTDRLTDLIQAGTSPVSADTGERFDEGLDIPTFLRRGHADCPVREYQGVGADA